MKTQTMTYGTVVGGDYMVVRPLGGGSMGTLYVAEQLSTSSHRALKVLRPEYASDATLFKRFEHEAQAAARIPSEHVTQVIAAGFDRKLELPWIAMELLDGQTLGQHVDAHGPLPRDVARDQLEQIFHAVSAAHQSGIVHRDIKPANIFLSEARRVGTDRVVKVLDFGIVKMLTESVTLQDVPLGTPSWMSPEQATGDPITPATDVWALALLAFYMLTGRPFWLASQDEINPLAVTTEIIHAPIPRASVRAVELGAATSLPEGFDDWFAQCVVRDPAARFVSAGPAWAALSSVLRTPPSQRTR